MTRKKTNRGPVILGKTYYHPDLGPCTALKVANHSETDEPMIVYQSNMTESYYTTRVSNWMKKFKKMTLPKGEAKNGKTIVEYPEPGCFYRHYKGGKYIVHFLAKDTDTGESVVIYQSVLFGSNHVRPLSMWFDRIAKVDALSNIPRFAIIEDKRR